MSHGRLSYTLIVIFGGTISKRISTADVFGTCIFWLAILELFFDRFWSSLSSFQSQASEKERNKKKKKRKWKHVRSITRVLNAEMGRNTRVKTRITFMNVSYQSVDLFFVLSLRRHPSLSKVHPNLSSDHPKSSLGALWVPRAFQMPHGNYFCRDVSVRKLIFSGSVSTLQNQNVLKIYQQSIQKQVLLKTLFGRICNHV